MLVIDELKEAGVSRVHCNLESSRGETMEGSSGIVLILYVLMRKKFKDTTVILP
ncbi:hypothetical protein [uncultured Clostridium sp.]|uniref:hypothetical protein n=1 Tax=uncultured Clostridium sp. TaxID=59620 RepID=UPI0025FAFB8B|nr:hypothetical protein [uncultured Clostridium sp.]